MKFRDLPKIASSEITPESTYLNRRAFMRMGGIAAAGALLASCAIAPEESDTPAVEAPDDTGSETGSSMQGTAMERKDEYGDAANAYEAVVSYNNFYEFTTDKQRVASLAKDFPVRPWTVEVGGLVNAPQTFAIEDLLSQFPAEERIYRMRCVEGWSMVIPWSGFTLASLLKVVEPTSDAKYVAFQTLMSPDDMPGQRFGGYPWPYTEGLRMDEAMNDLTLMVTGLYGKDLPPQNGAPLRLAVPWKYGFKSIKSIVRIDLVAEEPPTLWKAIASNEYGFYANVNPEVDHPRWSQATERRIGESRRRETLKFNGYGEAVADLYAGMDLRKNY